MAEHKPTPPKPVSDVLRPEITQLPEITAGRNCWRRFWTGVARLLVRLLARTQVTGLENFPKEGGVLAVTNHLGDADMVFGMAVTPRTMDFLVKSELYDFPLLGGMLRTYGVIMVHRGQPDRRAIRAALDALSEGRALAIAPEGRESLSGALEEGTHGAAYLALKADVPILPVTFTGTENASLLANIRRLRRTPMTVTIGKPFRLEPGPDRKASIDHGTERIMRVLARQLPPEYRGVYQTTSEDNDDLG